MCVVRVFIHSTDGFAALPLVDRWRRRRCKRPAAPGVASLGFIRDLIAILWPCPASGCEEARAKLAVAVAAAAICAVAMPLAPANQAQLIRSCQKDEYYQSFLRNNANEAFQTLGGERLCFSRTAVGSSASQLEARVCSVNTRQLGLTSDLTAARLEDWHSVSHL